VAAAPPAIERITFRPEQPEDEPFFCRLYASTRTEEMALTGWPVEQQEAFLQQLFQFQTLTTATTTARRSKSFFSKSAPWEAFTFTMARTISG
jgi:hypothetical protein